jgi:hypothetical protein
MLGAVISHSTNHVLERVGVIGLVVAFFAALMRGRFRKDAQREQALARGESPRVPTIRGMRPAKSHRWFWATPILRTSKGAQVLDTIARIVAWGDLAVFVLSLVITWGILLA